jgi:hypothetical protein
MLKVARHSFVALTFVLLVGTLSAQSRDSASTQSRDLASTESRGLEVVARAISDESSRIGKQYLVIIAVDAYTEWIPLANPVRDAHEIRDILIDRYYIDQVFELYDGNATKAGILASSTASAPSSNPKIHY